MQIPPSLIRYLKQALVHSVRAILNYVMYWNKIAFTTWNRSRWLTTYVAANNPAHFTNAYNYISNTLSDHRRYVVDITCEASLSVFELFAANSSSITKRNCCNGKKSYFRQDSNKLSMKLIREVFLIYRIWITTICVFIQELKWAWYKDCQYVKMYKMACWLLSLSSCVIDAKLTIQVIASWIT